MQQAKYWSRRRVLSGTYPQAWFHVTSLELMVVGLHGVLANMQCTLNLNWCAESGFQHLRNDINQIPFQQI